MGSFRPGAGNQHLHWYFNFTGCIVAVSYTHLDVYKRQVDEQTATEDACRIEHVISQESFEAIKRHLHMTAEK